MNRVDELTATLLERELDGPGEAELAALLRDPEARRRHVGLLEVEAGLRGRARVDVRAAVLDRLEGERSRRVVAGVMTAIRRRRRRRAWPWALAAAACAALASWAAVRDRRGAEAPPATAQVVEVHGTVEVVRGRDRLPAAVGAPLRTGDAVVVRGGAAVVAHAGASLRLGGGSAVRIAAPPVVQGGPVEVDAPAGALVLTPQARVQISGRVSLAVDARETRLAVRRGRARLERLAGGVGREVSAGEEAGTLETAAALTSAPAPAAPAPSTVLALDFEDGALPPFVQDGALAPSPPPRPGNRHALIGTVNFHDPRTGTVSLERFPELFRYADRQVLSFDYWLGADGRRIAVQAWNADRRQNYEIYVREVVRGAWARLEIRLADLRPLVRKTVPMEPGDRVTELMILGGRMGGEPFYVDNLSVVELPAP